jgi:hypothetical protein
VIRPGAGLAALLALLCVACSAPGAPATPGSTPDLTPFVGVWSRHGAGMTVVPDGGFSVEWRTYRVCGQDPPPCDQIVNNLLTDGGRAIGTMHATGVRAAAGQVSASNDATVVPAGSFTADVTDYQLLTLRFPSATLVLCGKNFAALAPTRVVRSQPCGA